MKIFRKSRLRKGISIVAAMVLLLNAILPTVPVFAETKAELESAGVCASVDGTAVGDLGEEAYGIVARVGEACYTSFSAENASEGGTITLMGNVELNDYVAIQGRNIDLNGFTVSGINNNGIFDCYGNVTITDSSDGKTGKIIGKWGVWVNPNANVTIEDVSIEGTKYGVVSDDTVDVKNSNITGGERGIAINNGNAIVSGSSISSATYGMFTAGSSNVTINNSNISSEEYGMQIVDSSNVTIDNSTVLSIGNSTGCWGVAVFGTATLTVQNGASIIGQASDSYGISTNGNAGQNATITINDGTIRGGELGIYQPSGTVTINGGSIVGATAIYQKAGILTITGNPTITSNAPEEDYQYYGNGAYATADAVVVDNCGYPGGVPSVSIEGGTFETTYGNVIGSYVKQDDPTQEGDFDRVFGFVKGGIFTEKPDINYISDGYSVYKNNDSKYVVTTIKAAEQGAAEATVTPDPVVAAETTFTTGAAEDFSAAIPVEDSSKTSVVEQKLPDAGDDAVYTLVVDTQETIEKVDESGNTTTTMTGVKESELRSSAGKTPEIKGGAEVYIQKADGTNTGRNIKSVDFTKPVAIPIFVGTSLSGQSVFVKVKHATGDMFGITGLVTDGTDCAAVATSTPSITVGANGFVIVYTCKASTFVAYTETGTTSSSTPASSTSTSGGGGGGGSSSYSCKSLPANAVANNTSKPKKNTNYSYSTDTGAVCTFQCKSGYTWNEKDEKCEKYEETVADTNENTDNADTSDSTATEDLKKVLDDGYTVEFHNAYDFAFKNGITTMPSIDEAHMNSPLTRIAMAKMLSQYAINVLGKKPANVVVPNFPDVSPELDNEYNSGVTLAYQLGIMGINIENFRPDDLVTRAEFATALSRLLYNTPDGEGVYYETHLKKLMEEKVITVADPDMHELRGYVMIMLMRSAKNN